MIINLITLTPGKRCGNGSSATSTVSTALFHQWTQVKFWFFRGGDREDYYNPEIVRPGDHVIPDLRHFVRTPKILTREGREQLRNLRSNVGGPYGQRRTTRLAKNPDTPQQSVETPPRSQTETHIPRSPEKRKPLSKLFGWVSSPDSQNKIATPWDIPSPEFISQTFEVDKRDTEFL